MTVQDKSYKKFQRKSKKNKKTTLNNFELVNFE